MLVEELEPPSWVRGRFCGSWANGTFAVDILGEHKASLRAGTLGSSGFFEPKFQYFFGGGQELVTIA